MTEPAGARVRPRAGRDRRWPDRRRALAGRDWNEIALGLRVTASIGVAALRPGMRSGQLYQAADTQLYAAKHGGRNQFAA